jgi:hypothetical protein
MEGIRRHDSGKPLECYRIGNHKAQSRKESTNTTTHADIGSLWRRREEEEGGSSMGSGGGTTQSRFGDTDE